MNRSHFKWGLLIVMSAVGLGCSGGQPAANTNAVNASNAVVNQPAAVNANNTATESREYPTEVAEEFIKSCEESGSPREFCACMFDKVKQQYTFEQFSVIETKISAGAPPEEFVEFTGKARAACTK